LFATQSLFTISASYASSSKTSETSSYISASILGIVKAKARFSCSWVNGSPHFPDIGDTISLDPGAENYNVSSITQLSLGQYGITSSVITTTSTILLTSYFQEFNAYVKTVYNGSVKISSGRGSFIYTNIPFVMIVI
jgi:hypothetical protein